MAGTSNNLPSRLQAHLIDLNELPPPDHEDVQGSHISPHRHLSREEVKASFPSCSHKKGCAHWKNMKGEDKRWSRTHRSRISRPIEDIRAGNRKYSKTYKAKIYSNPKRKEDYIKHTYAQNKARLESMTEAERKAYTIRRREISLKRKQKSRLKEKRERSMNEDIQQYTPKRRKTGSKK